MEEESLGEWFQVWDRSEYQEWALPTSYGYLLVIKRKQHKNWLLARAKLIFEEEGLPIFETLESKTVEKEVEAAVTLNEWKAQTIEQ